MRRCAVRSTEKRKCGYWGVQSFSGRSSIRELVFKIVNIDGRRSNLIDLGPFKRVSVEDDRREGKQTRVLLNFVHRAMEITYVHMGVNKLVNEPCLRSYRG